MYVHVGMYIRMHTCTYISMHIHMCLRLFSARMGNPKAALELIIKKLQDVDKVCPCKDL